MICVMNLLRNGLLEKWFLVCLLILVFASNVLLLLVSSSGFSNETDRLVLLDIKGSLSGNVGLASWNESSHFCQWEGVVCGKGNARQRVEILELYNLGLAGSLPPSIGNLTFLRTFDFGSNKLVGNIPKEMGFLKQLRSFNVTDNLLEGYIPVELMNCSELRVLHMASNNLYGSLPFEVGYLSKLSVLVLESNKLSGSIPSSIGYLSHLQMLLLWKNSITGTIPSSIGNLSSLLIFSAGQNYIDGEIPSDIGNLKKLEMLQLSVNRLSGTIPASLYNLSFISEISLTKNNLQGDFMPNSVVNVPKLTHLIFGHNNFTGSIPEALLNITTLQEFDAPNNNLTGVIPSNLGVLRNLRRFNVEFNKMGSGKSGDLEFLASLSNVSDLSVLSLLSNRFGGEFPASFLNRSTQLTKLTIGYNQISGRIPDGIGKQKKLIQLAMDGNDLEGLIPNSIGNLVMLEKIHLNGNYLSGSIPSSIGNLTRLFFLDLADNNLEGNIPSSLKQCNLLQNLYLYLNMLSGEIPEDFLRHFDQLSLLDLSQNFLTGLIPSEVGQLKNLGDLTLFNNELSGEIPEQLGECIGLEFLDISENHFVGVIPSSLRKLKALQYFAVSQNKLSGRIPTQLENLTALWFLNLSFNDLEGQVPFGGVFGNSSGFLFEKNVKLFGGIPQLHLPRCDRETVKTHRKMVIVLVVISCVGFAALVISCSLFYWKRKVKSDSRMIFSEVGMVLRVTYNDLHKATSGFDPSNLIGVGSFGSVYKGLLFEEQKPVAVKVLNVHQRGALKTFQAECRSLGTVRHRNLLKILTTCSSVDNKGNGFMALIFELMPNGSLENWLHESRSLSLEQRVDIALDIALALDYLHNGCVPPVIHCDLKPSNILLDQDMTVRVGDFGLAKILSGEHNRDRSSSNVVKGSIGYIPPEYGMGSKVSPQGDVYSFGILLLEMITGMRPTSHMFANGIDIHEYVKRALPDRAWKITDSRSFVELEGGNTVGREMKNFDEKYECINSMLEIGVACSSKNPSERMDIPDVINALIALKTKLIEMDTCVSNRSDRQDKCSSSSKLLHL